MAFTILVEGKDPKGEEASLEYTWKIEEKKPMPDDNPYWLQATREEYAFICTQFANIPIRKHSNCCQWTGEMAEFIFNNL